MKIPIKEYTISYGSTAIVALQEKMDGAGATGSADVYNNTDI